MGGNPYSIDGGEYNPDTYNYNTTPVPNYGEAGFDMKFGKDYLDQQEVNSGEGARDQIENYKLEEEKYPINDSITVTEPHQVGGNGYTVYKLKGTDEKGEFEVERRFKEFEAF